MRAEAIFQYYWLARCKRGKLASRLKIVGDNRREMGKILSYYRQARCQCYCRLNSLPCTLKLIGRMSYKRTSKGYLFCSKVLRAFSLHVLATSRSHIVAASNLTVQYSTVQYSTINHRVSAVEARKVKQECQTENQSIPCAVP